MECLKKVFKNANGDIFELLVFVVSPKPKHIQSVITYDKEKQYILKPVNVFHFCLKND